MNSRSCLRVLLGTGLVLAAGCADPDAPAAVAKAELQPVGSFGSNPGNLSMFAYAPLQAVPQAPLVVAMHGCSQSATSYDDETGWTELADRHGFYLVLPEQRTGNNSSRCFNWFEPGDIQRGQGEARSIRSMVDEMLDTYDIDPSRVYVTGLSAGGFMTSVMLATYPEVFAGGAVIAGGPYRCATNLLDAFGCMSGGRGRTPSQWAASVFNASSHTGPWPRVSIWHGTSDFTVDPVNLDELVEQWTAVHGTDAIADATETVNGYPRSEYAAGGSVVVESYAITGMGHGTPIDPGSGPDQCGTPGAFILDAGICSSYYVSEFWGILDQSGGASSSSSVATTTTSTTTTTTTGAGGSGAGGMTGAGGEGGDVAAGGGDAGGAPPTTGPFCGAATNLEHFDAGRAVRLGNVPWESYSAVGSYQWLGYADETTRLKDDGGGTFVEVTSCP
ncbi:MAG: PHB depolymerase family esterase [Myxococcota bacterium]